MTQEEWLVREVARPAGPHDRSTGVGLGASAASACYYDSLSDCPRSKQSTHPNSDRCEQAVFHPEDDRYLVHRETFVHHYRAH